MRSRGRPGQDGSAITTNRDTINPCSVEQRVIDEALAIVTARASKAALLEALGIEAPEILPFEPLRAVILFDRAARRSRWVA